MNTTPIYTQLERVFTPYGKSAESCEIRAIQPKTGEVVQKWFAMEPKYLQKAAVFCDELCEDYDVYFGVLPRVNGGGYDSDVNYAAHLWVDIDAGKGDNPERDVLDRLQRVRGVLPMPSMVVLSGSGGAHLYWQLAEVVSLPDTAARMAFSGVLRRLCRHIGGEPPSAHPDLSCVNVSRILRVVGTLNHKHDPKKQVMMVTPDTPDLFDLAWWKAHLPMEPAAPVKQKFIYDPNKFPDGIAPGIRRWAEQGYPEGKRHQDLTGAAKWLKRDCKLPDERGWNLFVLKASRSNGGRQIDESELEKVWNWA